eukprot:TRINITY_DN10884_c0_g1_i2.p1 TRINITY_DN10884_c0_g1~~TRINITY_DN10884_c0_g1_i2.p1  ORF type:complete len:644 (+),score=136.80 TRINITY_DN10884_c0_g1_i2:14-1945(+)
MTENSSSTSSTLPSFRPSYLNSDAKPSPTNLNFVQGPMFASPTPPISSPKKKKTEREDKGHNNSSNPNTHPHSHPHPHNTHTNTHTHTHPNTHPPHPTHPTSNPHNTQTHPHAPHVHTQQANAQPSQRDTPNEVQGTDNISEELPTNVSKRVYAKGFMMKLRLPPHVMPHDDEIIKTIKSMDIWVENYNLVEKKDRNEKNEMDQFKSAIQSNLNKLSTLNFTKLSQKIVDIFNTIPTFEYLKITAEAIQEKAILVQNLGFLYSDLVKILLKEPKTFLPPHSDKEVSLRHLLLNRCQEVFEASLSTSLQDVDEEQRGKLQRKYMGNLNFLGELFKKQIVPSQIIIGCLEMLSSRLVEAVSKKEISSAENCCEYFCKLYSTVGKFVDSNPKCKDKTDKLFSKVEVASQQLSNRFRFKMQDLSEVKKKNWLLPMSPMEISFETDKKANSLRKEAATVVNTVPTRTVTNRRIIDTPKDTLQTNPRETSAETTKPLDNGANFVMREAEKKLTLLIQELIENRSLEEAVSLYQDLHVPREKVAEVISFVLNFVMDKKESDKQLVQLFLFKCTKDGHWTTEQFQEGLGRVLSDAPDLVLDIPDVYRSIAKLLSSALSSGCINSQFVNRSSLEHFLNDSKAVDTLITQLDK